MPDDNEKEVSENQPQTPKDPFESGKETPEEPSPSLASSVPEPSTNEQAGSVIQPTPTAPETPDGESAPVVASAASMVPEKQPLDAFTSNTDASLQSQPAEQPQSPVESPAPPVAPVVPATGLFASDTPAISSVPPKKAKKKWLLPVLIASGVAVLAGAFIGFKAYTSTPSYVWNKSLDNTKQAYAQLDEQLTKVSEYKGSVISGKLALSSNGTEITGDFKAKTSGDQVDTSTDVTLVTGDANNAVKLSAGLDVRVVGTGEYPDIYIRARDLDKIGSLLTGFGLSKAEVDGILMEYNNQWYVLEGSTIKQLSESATGGNAQSQTSTPAVKDLFALLKKVGNATSNHVFTADTSKAVLVQKEFVGKEDKNGSKTYHYKATINKAGVKAYGQELKKILADDATARSLMSAKDKAAAEKQLAYLDDLSKELKENETTVDVWVDNNTKLIQTIRFSDTKKSQSFMEISQLYTGGDELPLQVVVQDTNTKMTLKFTSNTKKNENTYSLKATTPTGDVEFTAVQSLTNSPPNIEKPANAKSLESMMEALLQAYAPMIRGQNVTLQRYLQQ